MINLNMATILIREVIIIMMFSNVSLISTSPMYVQMVCIGCRLMTSLVVYGLEIGNDSCYNYDLLLSDYNLREINETPNITQEESISNDNQENNFLKTFLEKTLYNIKNDKCSDEEMNHINMKSIICLLKSISNPNHPSNIIFKRLRRIVQIWLFIYLITALPLWFTRGWCCCCFYCKFLKPSETIEEAKKYLALNPPGILIDDRGRVIYYEPTIYEKESYERFEHLIRTI